MPGGDDRPSVAAGYHLADRKSAPGANRAEHVKFAALKKVVISTLYSPIYACASD